jgi:23S rRNA pseudouridine1911/1915/1917 synthase
MKTNSKNLNIIYEDNHLIVVNKRAGDIVQGDKTGDTPLSEIIKKYIKIKYNKPGNVFLGVVHRLDRPTSGLVVFAKTSKALKRLNKAFAEHKPSKTYWAIVRKPPEKEASTLVHYLKRNHKQNKSYANVKPVNDSKKAVLNYRIIKKLDNFHLLEIQLETGRHHQIRSQLSAIGSPIKGDLKYGAKRSNPDASICLHARYLELEHPVKKNLINFEADVPNDQLWQDCL